MQHDAVVAATRAWLERAVIGLNLCPFAKAAYAKGQVHVAVCAADSRDGVLQDLGAELDALVACDPTERETTLLVVPHCLRDFLEFHEAAGRAERLIRKKGCQGVIQLATFHPHYRFADASEDDMGNCSNRSPYPTLHLLRESSITRAVNAFPQAESIYGANISTLRALGPDGWEALNVGPSR
jgi:hypothetical protein